MTKESQAHRELLMVVLASLIGVLVAFLNVAAHAPQALTVTGGVVIATLISARLSRRPLAGALIFCCVGALTTIIMSR